MKTILKTIALMLMLSAPAAVVLADNVPVEMSEADAPSIKAQPGGIRVDVPGEEPCRVVVYALTGSAVKQFDAPAGVTTVDLPTGIYVVRAGSTTVRVAVK